MNVVININVKQNIGLHPLISERRSAVRVARGERGIWQCRFWEHVTRDDADYAAHIDYCHINPVKHGSVKQVSDRSYSTFYRYVERGLYPLDWSTSLDINFVGGEHG